MITCTCGCNKKYPLNMDKPVKFKVVSYTSISHKPLEIKRLSDNKTFRLGDTIKRISKTGKKYKRFILTEINISGKKLYLWGYVVDIGGLVRIDNSELDMKNARNPNIFRYIYK